jgi:DnaK suppressor protein
MKQRANRHVAADTGERIEHDDPHRGASIFPLRGRTRGARGFVCAEFAMRRRELNTFRKLLHERRHELLAEALRTVDGMGETDEQFPDPTDRASLEDNRNLTLRIRDRERKLITKIDEALGRIDDGSYGKCEECGSDIGIARLKARPVTTLCIDCKSLQEAQERRLRTS